MTSENNFHKQPITSDEAINAVSFGSNAIKISNFIYISNQLPIDPLNQSISENIEIQTNQVIQNMVCLLAELQLQLSHIVKLTIYVTDLSLLPLIEKVYRNYFEEPFPAITVLQIAALQKGAKLSMDAVAIDTTEFDYISMNKKGKCVGCSGCSKCGK